MLQRASSLLLQEPPLQVLPTLATALGLEAAVVLQQLYFLLQNPKNGRSIGGERYIFNTYEQWHADHFPFIPERSLRRIFVRLEKTGLIISCQPEGTVSRRKYYRIGMGALAHLTYGRFSEQREASKLAASKKPSWPLPLTEITNREERNETTGKVLPAACLPEANKLPEPSIEEVAAEAKAQGIPAPTGRRFFCVNQFNGWRTITKHAGRITPIRHWKAALSAFAVADRKRIVRMDAITNDEFWNWATATFNEEQMAHVRDWVDLNTRRGFKQLNKVNRTVEPITDFRKSVDGYVRFCDDCGIPSNQ